MNFIKKKKKASIMENMLVMLLELIVVCAFLVSIFGAFSGISDKWGMRQAAREYMLIMETEGYLNASDQAALRTELESYGLRNISFSGTTTREVNYGDRMDKYLSGYEVTSFAAESFDGGVNGSLRKGDIVSVYAIDPATEMLVLMADNVYIADVYDSSGNKVVEHSGIATSFTVYVIEEEVEQINKAVVYGGIQMYLKAE